jgi:hypothetical protein
MNATCVGSWSAMLPTPLSHAFPLTEGWQSKLQKACLAQPAALIWDDFVIKRRRGFRPEAFRPVWPKLNSFFYRQVDHPGRCAVRAGLLGQVEAL